MTGRHGTLYGERQHRAHGETPCPACAAARATYQAAYRAAHPDAVALARRQAKARREAWRQLAAAHPDEFAQYQAQALRRINETATATHPSPPRLSAT